MGIRLGMPVAQAVDLAATTNLCLEEHDRDADRQSLQQLAAYFQTHLCPITAVETLERFKWHGRFRHDPEAILSEIQGVTHLFEEGERGLLASAAGILRDHHVHGRLAIANTLGAAWALSNTAPSQSSPQTFAFFVAPPQSETSAINQLPPSALRLQPATIDTLHRLGIRSIGDLLKLPRDGLATRLGTPLCNRIAQAIGEKDEMIVSINPQCEHSAALDMEYPTQAMDLLEDRISRLINQSITELKRQQRGVLRLQCQVHFEEHPPILLESGLFAPTLQQSHLCQLMTQAFQTQRLASKVTRLAISVTQHGPLTSHQPILFDDSLDDRSASDWTRSAESARLIDALSGRLGEEAVRGVRLTNDPLPEHVIADFPMTSHRLQRIKPKKKRVRFKPKREQVTTADEYANSNTIGSNNPSTASFTESEAPASGDVGRRPLELLANPIKITPLGQPASSFGPLPTHFRISGHTHAVIQSWGPERIETRWWRGTLIRRDYYRIELDDHRRLWIYHNLNTTAPEEMWLLHGQFA